MFGLLWQQSIAAAGRYFQKERFARSLTVFLFIVVIVLLCVGVYELVAHGFMLIAAQQFLQNALSLYAYELSFLVIGILVFVSALVSGSYRLFEGSYDFWTMASPRFFLLPLLNALSILSSSLWPLLVIGLPTLIAVSRVFHPTPLAFLLALLSLLLLGVIAVSAALSVLLLVALLSHALTGRARRNYGAAAVILLCALCGALLWAALQRAGDIAYVFPGAGTGTGAIQTSMLAAQFSAFPSHAVAEVFLAGQMNAPLSAFQYLAPLLLLGAAFVALFALLAKAHLTLWQDMQERGFQAGRFSRTTSAARTRDFGTGGPLRVLFEKEALVLFRNERTFLWFGFVLLLWLLQVAFDVVIRHAGLVYASGIDTVSVTVQSFQLVIIVYFIAIFVLRLVFPSFSAERDTAWLLGSMPIEFRRLFRAKFFFYALLLVALSAAVSLLHIFILGLPLKIGIELFILAVVMTFTLVMLGLTLGVLFPNFETSDPEILSTSLPGLVFIVLALLYGSLGALSLREFLLHGSSLGVLELVAGSVVFFALLHVLSRGALKRFEFAA